MTKRKMHDMLPLIVEETICVKGGRLGDKAASVPFQSVTVDDIAVRIFAVRKRDHWMLTPLLPHQEKQSDLGAQLVLKVQQKFQHAILEHRRGKGSKESEERAGEAAKGRNIIGLSEDEGSNSDGDIVVEPPPAAPPGRGRRYYDKAAAKLSKAVLRLEEVPIEIEDGNVYTFRVVEPTNVRGFRVEATKASVLAVLKMSQHILKGLADEKAGAVVSKPTSWKAKESSAKERDVDKLEESMCPIHGVLCWSPSHHSWMIYYREQGVQGRPGDRKTKEFKVDVKDRRTGAVLPRRKFLIEKYTVYKNACAEWNKLDKSTKKRLRLDADV